MGFPRPLERRKILLKITYKRKQKNLGVGNRETIWTEYLNF